MLLAEYPGLGEQQWRTSRCRGWGIPASPLGLASRSSVASKRGRSVFSVHCSIFRRRKSYFKPLQNVFMALSESSVASWSHGN